MSTIQIDQLRKTHGGIVAVDGMDLDVLREHPRHRRRERGGEVDADEGALAGAVRPDAGTISIDGEPIELGSASAARQHGIGIVYQELSILPDRPLLANLFVNRQPTRFGLVATREMERRAGSCWPGSASTSTSTFPWGRCRSPNATDRVGRRLLEQPRVLILDEPNSALNDRETQRSSTILRELAAAGITVLYVSHRLEEVFSIADRVTVMRDGREILTRDTASLTIPQVVEAMVGAKQESLYPSPRQRRHDAPACRQRALRRSGLVDVSFEGGRDRRLAGIAGSASSCCWGRCSASGALGWNGSLPGRQRDSDESDASSPPR